MIGAVVGIAIAVLVFWCCLVGIPYLYRSSTVAAAGGPAAAGSLSGVWVGSIVMEGAEDYSKFLREGGTGVPRKAASSAAAMQVTASRQLTWGVQKFKGDVTVCNHAGVLYTGSYSGEALLGGSHLQLLLHASDDSKSYSHLRAEFQPEQLKVHLELQDRHTASGVLEKRTAEQFQQLCRDLQQQ